MAFDFEDFYRTSFNEVWSFAARRLGKDDAADVVADVYMAAAIAYREGNEHVLSLPWLIAVCRNKVIDRWRMAERRRARAHLVAEHSTPLTDVRDIWADDVRPEHVVAALDRLKPRHRSLLVLFHVDGMSVKSIAESAGESSKAVESALARARVAFRRVYEEVRCES